MDFLTQPDHVKLHKAILSSDDFSELSQQLDDHLMESSYLQFKLKVRTHSINYDAAVDFVNSFS